MLHRSIKSLNFNKRFTFKCEFNCIDLVCNRPSKSGTITSNDRISAVCKAVCKARLCARKGCLQGHLFTMLFCPLTPLTMLDTIELIG